MIQTSVKLFFDSPKVIRAVDTGRRKALTKGGAFVRRSARSLIRKRKRTSQPGQPPSSHEGTLKRFIEFASDDDFRSVVVGPAKTNQIFFDGDGQPTRGTVPKVLEEGGEVRILEVFQFGKWRRADLRSRRRLAGLPTRLRTVKIAARPYMHPAFVAGVSQLPKSFRDVVEGR